MSALNRELRMMDDKMSVLGVTYQMEPPPIYLYLTTNGGEIYAAMSAIDCIKQLRCPLYTVVDGFVASAGTLLSLAGTRRFIQPNAYMLLHELRSGFWGKMSDISEEFDNLKKMMDHLIQFYTEHTSLKAKQLEKLLTKDSIWNAKECLEKGVVDEIYAPKRS
jgi:ATP-dependent Clp protease protease subunit